MTNRIYRIAVGLLSGLVSVGAMASGDWDASGTHLNYMGGNVGIGTSNPGRLFTVDGNVALFKRSVNTAGFIIQHSGPGGVQTTFGQDVASGEPFFLIKRLTAPVATPFRMSLDAPQFSFDMDSNGRVGFGTQTQGDFQVSIAGKLRAEELNIITGWADYVFHDDYKLMPIKELENYIENNARLPGMPSAEEVSQNGADIGATTTKLLEKIEELTLYIIEQNKESEALKKQVAELSKRID